MLRETLPFLRDEVGAAVYVASYTDGEISITQYADSPTAPAVHEWVDFREAAHASAVGKALLVQLDEEVRREHLNRHRMEAFTPHTITSPEVLFSELDTRHPGEPLLDLQEYALGTVCAAVPIRTGTEPECVALSLPSPERCGRARTAALPGGPGVPFCLAEGTRPDVCSWRRPPGMRRALRRSRPRDGWVRRVPRQAGWLRRWAVPASAAEMWVLLWVILVVLMGCRPCGGLLSEACVFRFRSRVAHVCRGESRAGNRASACVGGAPKWSFCPVLVTLAGNGYMHALQVRTYVRSPRFAFTGLR
ncbi:IclR family transcriptional regulator domain-containing protein [Streptomyces sp. NBC_00435]|uniref:IclR family transcriptional regulator domain-containing protein n=1 Tax=Streptomyces sp. NBC_00435 TaxID=2903649 RepID=UPI003FA6C967